MVASKQHTCKQGYSMGFGGTGDPLQRLLPRRLRAADLGALQLPGLLADDCRPLWTTFPRMVGTITPAKGYCYGGGRGPCHHSLAAACVLKHCGCHPAATTAAKGATSVATITALGPQLLIFACCCALKRAATCGRGAFQGNSRFAGAQLPCSV